MTELIREYWDWFLFDTLVWTGALIGFALVLRRPVAKHLGAGAAYALWFLPMARLLFPPVTLPEWMKPASFESEAIAEPATALASNPVADASFSYAQFVTPVTPMPVESPIDFVAPLVILWFAGAVIFMTRRFWLYGVLRRELLEDARPVGEVGKIRLIETPAISGPMAFGVFDKVVALPEGFMVSRERQVRDLAIAHELAHHRGHDILVNVLIQPLFAVHWFNPLGWMGWTAMRRDQEAACDARVVASRSRDERAAYAAIIADFARRPQLAPRPALAAPMACPVLGDKSIIHRLKSLPMTDDSRRRRIAARGAVAAAVLALPMTASICYVGAAPALAGSTPELDKLVSPIGEADRLADQDAVPIAVHAQLAHLDKEGFAQIMRERAGNDLKHAERELARAEREVRRAEREIERAHDKRKAKNAIVWNDTNWDMMSAEDRRELKREMEELRRELAEGGEIDREIRAAMAEARADAAEARAEARAEAAEARAEAAQARAEARADAAEARAEARVTARAAGRKARVTCGDGDVRQEFSTRNGNTMVVCDSKTYTSAAAAIREARKGIERDDSMPPSIKAEILRSMDVEIAKLER